MRETHVKEKKAKIIGANIDMPDTQEPTKNPPCSAETIVEDSRLHSDTLIPQAEAHVRKDTHAHEPFPSSSKGAPNSTFPTSELLKLKGRKKLRKNNVVVVVLFHRKMPNRPRQANNHQTHNRRGHRVGMSGVN